FCSVPSCGQKRRKIRLDRDNPAFAPVVFECHRDRAGTGAEIEHRTGLPLERQVDQQFGFGPGHENRGIDREWNFLLRRGSEARLRKTAHLGQQQARLARIDARPCNRLQNLQAVFSESCASCSAWCSAASAATMSSSSPSMMRSILYKVRLMRWSVTRPCGKL